MTPAEALSSEENIKLFCASLDGLSVEERVIALQEAKSQFQTIFTPDKSQQQLAVAAKVVEYLYNYVRSILLADKKYHKVKEDPEEAIAKSAKPKPTSKSKSKTLNSADLLAEAMKCLTNALPKEDA